MRSVSRGVTRGLAVLIIVLAALAAAWWRRSPSARPNILLITIDTLRADRVAAYGARDVATPTLDRLAREGIRFQSAYATVPLTLPSHVSMLSGLFPPAHTVRTNDGFRVPDDVSLVPEALRAAGYQTGAVVGSVVLRRSTGLQRGFTDYDDEVGAGGQRRGDDVAARARAWLEQRQSRPWFLWVHFFDPHLDYDPPEPFRSEYAGRPYDGEVAYADSQIASLVDLLERQGQLRQTAVIATGDHGEGLGDHGEGSHGAMLYDPMVRVPLLLRLPSGAGGGRVVSEPVSLVEIAPTIRELAGLPAGGTAPGLLAQLRSDAPRPAPPISETVYLKMLLGWSPLYSFRAGRYKVIDAPTPELYDVEADPAERRNLAGTHRQRADDLLKVLRRELARSAEAQASPAARTDDPQERQKLAALGYVGTPGLVQAAEPVGGPAVTDRPELWRRIEEALALSHRGDHPAAARLFETVLHEDPDNALALKVLGAWAIETGDLSRAVAFSERVVARGLHVTDALSNLTLAYNRLGRTADALEAAGRALDQAPDHVAARFNRAVVFAGLGRDAEARSDLARVLELDPQHTAAVALRARLSASDSGPRAVAQKLTAAGDLAGAARALEAAIADQPGLPDLHDDLGIVRARAGDLPGARTAFERALALAPGNLDVRERLGAVLHRAGRRTEARAAFEAVIARAPERRAPRVSLAILDLEEGRPDRAVQRLEPLTAGWDGAPRALFYLAEARLATQDRTGARRAYRACLEALPPGDPMAAAAKRRLDALR